MDFAKHNVKCRIGTKVFQWKSVALLIVFLTLVTKRCLLLVTPQNSPPSNQFKIDYMNSSQIWCNRQAADKMWNEHAGLPNVALKYHKYVHLSTYSIPMVKYLLGMLSERCSPPKPKLYWFFHFTYQKSELVKALPIAAVMFHIVIDFCKEGLWLLCASHDWPRHLLAIEESLDRK